MVEVTVRCPQKGSEGVRQKGSEARLFRETWSNVEHVKGKTDA